MGLIRREGKGIIERYRPLRLSETIGNTSIKKSVESWFGAGTNRSRSLMFVGSSSAGKTTMARIIALGLNCERGDTGEPCLECESCKAILSNKAFHVFELNMSQLTGKEDADNIIKQMNDSCLTGRNKIYILDEIQMMSVNSMNAMLKTVENPPSNTYCIFCTTNPEKIIKPLINRCERYDFLPPSEQNIKDLLRDVCNQEQLQLSIEDKNTILSYSLGLSYREILTSLTQYASGGSGAVSSKINEFDANYKLLIGCIIKGDVANFSNNLRKFWNNRSEIRFDSEEFRRTLRIKLGYELMNETTNGITKKGMKIYDVLKIFDNGVYGANNESALPSIMKDGFAACVLMKG